MHDPTSLSKYCILIINCSAYKQSVLILHQLLQCTKFLNIVFLFLIIMDINNQFLYLLARYNTTLRYSKIMNNIKFYSIVQHINSQFYTIIQYMNLESRDTTLKVRIAHSIRTGAGVCRGAPGGVSMQL